MDEYLKSMENYSPLAAGTGKLLDETKIKDVLTCIDDFHPGGRYDEKELTRTAQMVMRAYGDRTGRGRLTSDSRLMESRPPQGNAIITAEYPPDIGESGAARYFLVEIGENDVDLKLLSEYQGYAERGLLQRVMKGFTDWITAQYLSDSEKEKGFNKTAMEKIVLPMTSFLLPLCYRKKGLAVTAEPVGTAQKLRFVTAVTAKIQYPLPSEKTVHVRFFETVRADARQRRIPRRKPPVCAFWRTSRADPPDRADTERKTPNSGSSERDRTAR